MKWVKKKKKLAVVAAYKSATAGSHALNDKLKQDEEDPSGSSSTTEVATMRIIIFTDKDVLPQLENNNENVKITDVGKV